MTTGHSTGRRKWPHEVPRGFNRTRTCQHPECRSRTPPCHGQAAGHAQRGDGIALRTARRQHCVRLRLVHCGFARRPRIAGHQFLEAVRAYVATAKGVGACCVIGQHLVGMGCDKFDGGFLGLDLQRVGEVARDDRFHLRDHRSLLAALALRSVHQGHSFLRTGAISDWPIFRPQRLSTVRRWKPAVKKNAGASVCCSWSPATVDVQECAAIVPPDLTGWTERGRFGQRWPASPRRETSPERAEFFRLRGASVRGSRTVCFGSQWNGRVFAGVDPGRGRFAPQLCGMRAPPASGT